MASKTKDKLTLIVLLFFFLAGSSAKVFASPEAAYQYNESGLEKLKSGNYRKAISDLSQARRYLPSNQKIAKNLAIAYNNYAFFLMGKGRLKLAAEQFERSLSYDQSNPYTLYNLGQVYYRLQKVIKAKKYLSEAYSLKPSLQGLKELYEKVKKEEVGESSFDKTETLHFIIASSPDLEVGKLSYIRVYLEEAYGKIGTFLGHYPEDKVVAILYSESNYKNLLHGKPHWALAIFDGKVRIPVNKVDHSGREIVKIIYHEYAHAVVQEMAGRNCPLWLKEGVASYTESFVAKKNKDFYRAYLQRFGVVGIDQFPSDFMAKGPKVANWLYVQSYLLVDFIVSSRGPQALRDVLGHLGQAKSIKWALEDVFGGSIKNIEQEWLGYLRDNYQLRDLNYRSK